MIPDSFSKLPNLISLHIQDNLITVIPDSLSGLTSLTSLDLSNNMIIEIPDSFSELTSLISLYLSGNRISKIPYSLINLRNLSIFEYRSNPIDFIHPNIIAFLNRHKNITSTYNDSQSVHKSSIQESVKKSIQNIMSISHDTEEDILCIINSDDILTIECKEILSTYSRDLTTHSVLQINFLDVLKAVWNRIRNNEHKTVIKSILNIEMNETKGLCFTGRISRLINCLSGFDDLVQIQISDSERIGSIIALALNELYKKNSYSREAHIELSRTRLLELGYNQDIIDQWIMFI